MWTAIRWRKPRKTEYYADVAEIVDYFAKDCDVQKGRRNSRLFWFLRGGVFFRAFCVCRLHTAIVRKERILWKTARTLCFGRVTFGAAVRFFYDAARGVEALCAFAL